VVFHRGSYFRCQGGIFDDCSKLVSLFDALDNRHFRAIDCNFSDSQPNTLTFSAVRSRLLVLFGTSDDECLNQLLHHTKLSAGQGPTDLLDKMKRLLGNDAPTHNRFLRKLFLEQLPVNVRCMVVAQQSINLEQMAATADKIMHELGNCAFSERPGS